MNYLKKKKNIAVKEWKVNTSIIDEFDEEDNLTFKAHVDVLVDDVHI